MIPVGVSRILAEINSMWAGSGSMSAEAGMKVTTFFDLNKYCSFIYR